MHRVGLYAWGGPGTTRLLHTKYHSPRIDEASFMGLYEPDFLQPAREKLGVTDMWVTYSWGFSDATEQPDRRFIIERLPAFQDAAIAPHAYVQGLNLVTREFSSDLFCRDAHGRLLPYCKGRALTCANNPAARQVIIDRVAAACQENFSGVFVDNVMFGLPPFYIRRDYTSFFGCSCDHCQRQFRAEMGYDLPLGAKFGEQVIADYLDFRSRSVTALIEELAGLCRAAGKQFGVNLYDPFWYAPEFYFGYRLAEISPLLDYYLIENLALKDGWLDNTHLQPLLNKTDKPVFVVSYRRGIGYDGAYQQADVDAIWNDAAGMGYAPCLKATEYITRGIWHALDINSIESPVMQSTVRPTLPEVSPLPATLKSSSPLGRSAVRLINGRYPRFATAAFENRHLAQLLDRSGIATRMMHTRRTHNPASLMQESAT